MSLGPHWMVHSLIIFAAVFGVILANIWRHSKKNGDTAGMLLFQNFVIAAAGCAALFWYWGILQVPRSISDPSVSTAEVDCDSDMQRREVNAIRLCLRANDCEVTVADSLKVVTFGEVCAAKAAAERYKDGCTIINPVTNREMKLTEQQCWEFYGEIR